MDKNSVDPVRTAMANFPYSLESDLGCSSRIYFDNVTMMLHNVTLTSQKPCKHNTKCDCSITDGLLKNHNFICYVDKAFRLIKIMDFNRTGPTCYSTIFPNVSSG